MVSIPELVDDPVRALSFTVFPVEGPIASEAPLSAPALVRITEEIEKALSRPYAVHASRQTRSEWFVAAIALKAELVTLQPGIKETALQVVVDPGEQTLTFVGGEAAAGFLDPAVAEALQELERRGRERFQAFVARADKVNGGRWAITIDPL